MLSTVFGAAGLALLAIGQEVADRTDRAHDTAPDPETYGLWDTLSKKARIQKLIDKAREAIAKGDWTRTHTYGRKIKDLAKKIRNAKWPAKPDPSYKLSASGRAVVEWYEGPWTGTKARKVAQALGVKPGSAKLRKVR